jgi:hypothetical protein
MDAFYDDLCGVLRRVRVNAEKVCFIFDEVNVLSSGFIEAINALLGSSKMVLELFAHQGLVFGFRGKIIDCGWVQSWGEKPKDALNDGSPSKHGAKEGITATFMGACLLFVAILLIFKGNGNINGVCLEVGVNVINSHPITGEKMILRMQSILVLCSLWTVRYS